MYYKELLLRKYRTADGSCNNVQDGRLGKSDSVFNRLELPDYSDGVQALRKDIFGNDLPSPRLVGVLFLGNNVFF